MKRSSGVWETLKVHISRCRLYVKIGNIQLYKSQACVTREGEGDRAGGEGGGLQRIGQASDATLAKTLPQVVIPTSSKPQRDRRKHLVIVV